jgi:hypothetical protein
VVLTVDGLVGVAEAGAAVAPGCEGWGGDGEEEGDEHSGERGGLLRWVQRWGDESPPLFR